MRDDKRTVQGREIGDAAELGEAAAAVDVGLEDVDLPPLEPFAALVDGRSQLRAANPRLDALGEPRVAGEVVVAQRRLGEVDVAVLDPAERPERVAPVAPAVAEVEHQRDFVPEKPSSLADALDETAVADERLEQDLDLHRAEAEAEGPIAARGDVVHHLAERSARHRASVDRRVRGDGSSPGAAEQLVHGPAELPTDEVVQRDVHRGERMDAQPAAAVVHGALTELRVERSDLERIASEQHPAEPAAPGVDVVH